MCTCNNNVTKRWTVEEGITASVDIGWRPHPREIASLSAMPRFTGFSSVRRIRPLWNSGPRCSSAAGQSTLFRLAFLALDSGDSDLQSRLSLKLCPAAQPSPTVVSRPTAWMGPPTAGARSLKPAMKRTLSGRQNRAKKRRSILRRFGCATESKGSLAPTPQILH
jgi:hypothetical protein